MVLIHITLYEMEQYIRGMLFDVIYFEQPSLTIGQTKIYKTTREMIFVQLFLTTFVTTFSLIFTSCF